MTTRNLQVVVKATDQASATVRGIASRTVGAFKSVVSVAADATLAIGGVVRVAQTLHRIVANNETAAELDKIGKASRRLGESTEFISKLAYTAQLADLDLDGLLKTVSKFEDNLGRLNRGGNEQFSETLAGLGINARDARGQLRAVSDLLPEVADRMRDLGQERTAVARLLFGKGGDAIINTLIDSPKGFSESFDEASRLGVVYTRRMTDAAEAYNDSITRIDRAWTGVKARILTEVAPAITELFDRAADRIAQLAAVYRGTIASIRTWAGRGPGADEAGKRLKDLQDSGLDAVKVGLLSIAKIAGQVFVSAALVTFEASAPRISDILRDVAAPILNHLPGVNIELSKRGQLRQMQEQLDKDRRSAPNYRPRSAYASEAAYERDYNHVQVGPYLSPELDPLRDRQLEVERFAKSVEALERQRVEALRAVVDAQFDVIQDTVSEEWKNVTAAFDKLDTAYQSMAALGADVPEPEQKPEQRTNQWARLFNVLVGGAAVVDRLKLSLSALGKQLEEAAALRDLQIRAIAATSENGRALERIRLVAGQEKEARDTFKSGATTRVLNRLGEVQAAELKRFDVETAATDVLEKLTKARDRYSAAVARNSQLVEAGTIYQFQATRQNLAAADSVRELAEQAKGQIETIITANPELAKFLERYRDDVIQILGEIPAPRVKNYDTFQGGVEQGIGDLIERAQDFRAQGLEAFNLVADVGVNRLSSALTQAKFSFSDFAQSAVRDVAELTTRMLILRIVASGLKSFGFGGGGDTAAAAGAVPGPPGFAGVQFNRGGTLPRFADGGTMARLLLGPNVNRDVGLYAGTPGELVISRNQVRANGGHANVIGRLNRGEYGPAAAAPSQQIFNVTIQVQASPGTTPSQARQSGKHAAAGFLDEVERSPTLRARFRGVVQA